MRKILWGCVAVMMPLVIACGKTSDGDDAVGGRGGGSEVNEAGPNGETPVYRNSDGTPSTSIRCDTSICDSDSQECCASMGDSTGEGTTFTCQPKGTCSGAFAMACSSTANCPVNQVCCGTWMTGAPVVEVGCRDSCYGPTDEQFCAVDSECAPGQVCTQALYDHCSGDAGAPPATLK